MKFHFLCTSHAVCHFVVYLIRICFVFIWSRFTSYTKRPVFLHIFFVDIFLYLFLWYDFFIVTLYGIRCMILNFIPNVVSKSIPDYIITSCHDYVCRVFTQLVKKKSTTFPWAKSRIDNKRKSKRIGCYAIVWFCFVLFF